MSRTKAITLAIILLGTVSTALVWAEYVSSTAGGKRSKPQALTVALRSAGHQLLLANGNDSSRVLPLTRFRDNWLTMSFESKLSIEPDELVDVLNSSIESLRLPTNYWAEVRIGHSDSVVYSYLMDGDINSSIIPCFGRSLPSDNYTINVKLEELDSSEPTLILSGALILIVVVVFSAKVIPSPVSKNPDLVLGNYHLKKNERKLVHGNMEMPLTEKEVELLELFLSQPNQPITREELQYKVWESKGVVVGRSLDTYVSKLRRKLDKDDSVSIRNIRGSGYKLVLKF